MVYVQSPLDAEHTNDLGRLHFKRRIERRCNSSAHHRAARPDRGYLRFASGVHCQLCSHASLLGWNAESRKEERMKNLERRMGDSWCSIRMELPAKHSEGPGISRN